MASVHFITAGVHLCLLELPSKYYRCLLHYPLFYRTSSQLSVFGGVRLCLLEHTWLYQCLVIAATLFACVC